MFDWQSYVVIAIEFILTFIATVIGVLQSVRRLKSSQYCNSLLTLFESVPRAILLAECVFGAGNGEQKKEYALMKLQSYARTLSLDFDGCRDLLADLIEDVLQTPQKNLEVFDNETC